MNFLTLRFIIPMLVMATVATWWLSRAWRNNTITFVSAWVFSLALTGLGITFVLFTSKLCHYLFTDPPQVHYILFALIWVAITVTSFIGNRPRSEAIL